MESVTIGDETIDLEDYLADFYEPGIAWDQWITRQVYCSACKTMIKAFSVTPSGNFRCGECEKLFQQVEWANGEPIALRPYPFKCPKKCQGRTLADEVEIHVVDGYYNAICMDCGEPSYQGKTYRKQALEQLRQKAEEVADVEEFEAWVSSTEFTRGIPISEISG